MAQIQPDTSAPTVLPETQGITGVHATPEEAGALIGQGMEKLGAGATQLSQKYDEIAADDANNRYMDGATAIRAKMRSLNGQDALNYLPQAQQDLDTLYSDTKDSLWTSDSKLHFDENSRRTRSLILGDVLDYGAQQKKEYGKQVNDTAGKFWTGQAAAAEQSGDQLLLAMSLHHIRDAYAKNADLIYGQSTDPESPGGIAKLQYLKQADADFAKARINAIVQKDPVQAQRIYDQNAAVLGSDPDYDRLGREIKTQTIENRTGPIVDSNIANAKAAATASTSTGIYNSAQVSQAIGQTEWRGKGPAPTSVQGAVGPGQIEPGTWAEAEKSGLVKPGEKIDNAADNLAVKDRLVASYMQRFGNDPARVAVAYFSGPGNVAPPGSPTPWIRDTADKKMVNGKLVEGTRVSAYVGNVTGHLQGGVVGPSTKYPTTADYYRANYDPIIDAARTQFEKEFPNYPDAVERGVSMVQRRLDQTISQQNQQYEISTHVVQQALAADHPPISEDQLKAMSPQVAQAWQTMQINNPLGAMSVQRIFDANAKGKSVGFGSEFNNLLPRVLAPIGDPNRITNPTQLWPFVEPGEHGPLTNTGAARLSALLGTRGTPEGEANAAQLRNFLTEAHTMLSRQNPTLGFYDPKGEAAYQKFVAQSLPMIEAEQKAGKPFSAILAQKGDVYNSIFAFKRKPGQDMLDRITDPQNQNVRLQNNPIQSPGDLKTAVLTGKMSRADGEALALQRGWIRASAKGPPPPDVPLPQ